MNLLGAVWSNNALSTLRASPIPAFPSRNCLSQFGLGEPVLKPLFSGSHWVSRTSACENCCCDFLLLCGSMCVSGTRLLELRLPPATGTGGTPWSVQAGKCPGSVVMTETTCLVSRRSRNRREPSQLQIPRPLWVQTDCERTKKRTGESVLQSSHRNAHKITEADRTGSVTRIAPETVRWGGKRL